jgi:hypothetical protein
MQSLRESDRGDRATVPTGVQAALAFALAALLGGAGVLLAYRGEALLLDLAHFSRQMLCL